ncbi:hypothetical protein IQ37_01575 [Chryseobacterium piperi]|uniref:Lipoprotein n=1 Tax=Chryseobacterium piperi TaxID=558152 RepID=A0A086BLS7_9FLAO|nr:hypothetical protein [Chryseobacterium piperi]ASW75739.1 hypothetical protein CJF12_16605 [Chryseobacterium piperi]KFF29891.1 hypothetical protein IQ37_01575 [Chryseobacterium piperi]
MKNILIAASIATVFVSCSKKETQSTSNQVDSVKIIDSINAARTKLNDSIKNKNRFQDFSGSRKFTHNSIKSSGFVDFKKVSRDEYEVSGSVKSGKNYVTIKGTAVVVSPKHMNFTGEITQSIAENDNGKPYTRKGTKTFLSKDGGKTWRLQDMINGSGFADYIDIHF